MTKLALKIHLYTNFPSSTLKTDIKKDGNLVGNYATQALNLFYVNPIFILGGLVFIAAGLLYVCNIAAFKKKYK